MWQFAFYFYSCEKKGGGGFLPCFDPKLILTELKKLGKEKIKNIDVQNVVCVLQNYGVYFLLTYTVISITWAAHFILFFSRGQVTRGSPSLLPEAEIQKSTHPIPHTKV